MKLKTLLTTSSFIVFSSVLSVATTQMAAAQQTGEFENKCSIRETRSAVENVSIDALCSCDAITTGFIRFIQRHNNLVEVLEGTGESCPGLALLLSDAPTASIAPAAEERPDSAEDRQQEAEQAAAGVAWDELAEEMRATAAEAALAEDINTPAEAMP